MRSDSSAERRIVARHGPVEHARKRAVTRCSRWPMAQPRPATGQERACWRPRRHRRIPQILDGLGRTRAVIGKLGAERKIEAQIIALDVGQHQFAAASQHGKWPEHGTLAGSQKDVCLIRLPLVEFLWRYRGILSCSAAADTGELDARVKSAVDRTPAFALISHLPATSRSTPLGGPD